MRDKGAAQPCRLAWGGWSAQAGVPPCPAGRMPAPLPSMCWTYPRLLILAQAPTLATLCPLPRCSPQAAAARQPTGHHGQRATCTGQQHGSSSSSRGPWLRCCGRCRCRRADGVQPERASVYSTTRRRSSRGGSGGGGRAACRRKGTGEEAPSVCRLRHGRMMRVQALCAAHNPPMYHSLQLCNHQPVQAAQLQWLCETGDVASC